MEGWRGLLLLNEKHCQIKFIFDRRVAAFPKRSVVHVARDIYGLPGEFPLTCAVSGAGAGIM